MKRRNFLVGAGAAAIGGSALLGSGAFSEVNAQRQVTVQVAEDPNAYLGMDDCQDSNGNTTPNSSFASIDDDGHLQVDMTPSNPTNEGGAGDGAQGEGVNSESITWFDNVFQICNQGKEDVCLWISEKRGADPGRVTFYVDNDARSNTATPMRFVDDPLATREQVDDDDGIQGLNGVDNSIPLALGDCVCVGIEVYTREDDNFEIEKPSAGEQLLDGVTITADVSEGDCFPGTNPDPVACDLFGIDQRSDVNGDPGIRAVTTGPNVAPGVDRAATSLVDLTQPNAPSYPNAIAHVGNEQTFYFADANGVFYEADASTVPPSFTEYGELEGGTQVAGATYYDGPDGTYYYIPQGGGELKVADPDNLSSGDTPSPELVTDITDYDTINLGDLAVNEAEEEMYVSIVSGSNAGAFIEFDLSGPSGGTPLLENVSNASARDSAAGKQIAYGLDENGNPQLYAHSTSTGDWYEVEPGNITMGDPDSGVMQVDNTLTFTDLAQCGPNETN
jgi:hypothetical protein